MWKKSKINQEQLRAEIREMSPRSNLYRLLKTELAGLGHWKQLKRGKPNLKNIGGL
jgi:hypothetical protein